MPLRDVTIRLGLNPAQFIAGARAAQAASAGLATGITKNAATGSKSAALLGSSFGTVGIAVGLAGASMLSAAADFDQSMSNVKATGADAVRNIGALRQAALDAGAATKYSATEAAGGVEALLKAGVSASDVLGGGLTGALDLAAAGNLDVAGSAEAAASAMNQFGLAGKDVPHIADLLAAGAGKAQGEVSDMAMALNQAGLVANTFGYSIEETTGVLAEFASSGLTGSDAGTALKTMLLRLAAPTGAAEAALKKYHITTRGANHELLNASQIAGQLQQAFKGVDAAERDAALATIFGQDAIRGASILYKDSAEAAAGWTEAVNDQGFAADTAATKMDNLNGDIEKLKGTWETFLTEQGSGGQGGSRAFIQTLDEVLKKIQEADQTTSNFSLWDLFKAPFNAGREKGKELGLDNKPKTSPMSGSSAIADRQITQNINFKVSGAQVAQSNLNKLIAASTRVPKSVKTDIAQRGAQASTSSIRRLAAAYNTTPRRVATALLAQDLASGKLKVVKGKVVDLNGKPVKIPVTADVKAAEKGAKAIKASTDALKKGKTEVKVSTKDGASKVIKSVASSLATLNGKEAKTYITTVRRTVTKPAGGGAIEHGTLRGFADGGYWGPRAVGALSGPGDGTVDTIPAMLANGEHVLTASDVRMLGGQDAVFRMREQAQSGVLKFAAGGPVAPTSSQLQLERAQAVARIEDLQRQLADASSPLTGAARRVAELDLNEAWADLSAVDQKRAGLWFEYQQALADQVTNAAGGISSSTALSGLFGESSSPWSSPMSSQSILAQARGKLAAVKGFGARLAALKAKGLSGLLLQEIAGMGIDSGTRAADILLSDPSTLAALSRTYAEIGAYTQAASRVVVTAATPEITVRDFTITDWQQGMGTITMSVAKSVSDATVGAIR